MQNGESALHHAIRAGHYSVLEELIRVLFQVKSKAVAKLVINMPTDVSSVKPWPTPALAKRTRTFPRKYTQIKKKFKADIFCMPLIKKVAITTNGRHSTCVDLGWVAKQ